MYVVTYETPAGDAADEFFEYFPAAVAFAKRCDGFIFSEDDPTVIIHHH